MRILAILLIVMFGALPAAAQSDPERDRGLLQGFIEDNLSQDGRVVRIEGFEGALSSEATIETLTIADENGVWLTLNGLVLSWSRAALLRGRLEVAELSADEILLPRRPVPGTGGMTPPPAEATPFQLPELPISVNIGQVAVDRLVIGAPVFGEGATVTMEGSLSLAGGAGDAKLSIRRTDGQRGALTLDASYVNDTRQLSLALSLDEGADGIAANMLDLPGRPPLKLEISGDAPVTDFTADIRLSSDGKPRLTGQVVLTEIPGAAEGALPTRRITADLGGDIAPLFAPELRPFFGPEVQLSFRAERAPDGTTEVSELSLSAAALDVQGDLLLGADGMPRRFDLNGQISGDGPVTLPLSGPPTRITSARIAARFDAATDKGWTLSADLKDFSRAGMRLESLRMDGTGTIGLTDTRRVTASITARATGIELDDADLAAALGNRLDANATLAWQQGQAIRVSSLDLAGAGLSLAASGQIGSVADGLPVSGKARIDSDDIARFSRLAGRPLSGSASATATGRAEALTGAFDVDLTARTTDLKVNIAQLDPLLTGDSRLRIIADRDTDGTRLERLSLDNDSMRVQASGRVTSSSGKMSLEARLTDLGRSLPGLSGPATLNTDVTWQQGTPVQLSQLRLEGAGVDLTGNGTLDPANATLPVTGTADLSVADLSVFSRLANRPLSGALNLSISGSGALRPGDFDIELNARGRNLGAGLGDLDRLIGGESTLRLAAIRTGARLFLTELQLETPQLSAQASGGLSEAEPLEFSVRLADMALLAPDFPGPVTASGTARADGPDWRIAIDARGPGGTTARISGLVAGNGQRVDLTANGTAPLGLANSVIAPRRVQGTARFDLAIDGRPGLEALSGTVTTADAQVSAPTFGVAVTNLDASVALSGGQAIITSGGNVVGGGRIEASGPVQLSAPFDAGLELRFIDVLLRDPALFQTTLNGAVSVNGPLTGGGRIDGTMNIGRTEIRIPSSPAAPQGAVPDGLRHVNDTAAERQTRARAGLIVSGQASDLQEGGTGLGLDLLIRAPDRIFVRGRGLDAELGGQLRLTGTTSNVVPVGQFDLIRGRLDILGKRLVLDEGSIRLQGGFDPYLRLVATTEGDGGTLIKVIIEGPASAPEVTFQSQPELPEDEVIARLLFGRGIDSISPIQAAQLAGAVATLAGSGGGGLVSQLREGFGLDDLDVSTDETGAATLRVGKYLTDNIYTDVTVDSSGKSEVQLNLDVTPQVTFKGALGSTGESSVGIYYERDY